MLLSPNWIREGVVIRAKKYCFNYFIVIGKRRGLTIHVVTFSWHTPKSYSRYQIRLYQSRGFYPLNVQCRQNLFSLALIFAVWNCYMLTFTGLHVVELRFPYCYIPLPITDDWWLEKERNVFFFSRDLIGSVWREPWLLLLSRIKYYCYYLCV